MKRTIESSLDSWLMEPGRKPLVLRGARQVGKTWLVRNLAQRQGRDLVELNFEKDPFARQYFASNSPKAILDEIGLALNQPVVAEKAILFLDEIQAAGEVIAKLRWFAEEMPDLPVIAAGSLLEFTLADHDFSMPVGRIRFLHIEPMGFCEFLEAHGQNVLLQHLKAWRPGQEFATSLHQQASLWFHRFAMTGGMPAIVSTDTAGANARICRESQYDLMATYRADFAKYGKRIDVNALDMTLRSVALSIGKKFVYARIDDSVKQHQAKRAVELLSHARVCHLVRYTAANGIPLGGETKDKFRKALLNDASMLHALLRLPVQDSFPKWQSLAPQVRGQIAEQIVGQLLRLLGPFSGDGPELYYWQREGGRPGEIDYLIQVGSRIIPIELKSGAAGSMKSLHQFVFDKKLGFALRFDQNPPSQIDLSVKTTQGDFVRYRLLSLPWYCAEMLNAILTEGLLSGSLLKKT